MVVICSVESPGKRNGSTHAYIYLAFFSQHSQEWTSCHYNLQSLQRIRRLWPSWTRQTRCRHLATITLQASSDSRWLKAFGLAPVEPCSVSCVRSWFRNTIASYFYCSYRSYHVSEMLKLETRFACKFHRNTHGRGPTVTPNNLSPFLIFLNHSCMFMLGHGMSLHLKRLSGELCSSGRPCPGTVEETRKLCFVRFLPTIYGLAPWFLIAEIAPGACGKVTWQVIVSTPADTGTCQKRIKEADLKHAETVCKQRKA